MKYTDASVQAPRGWLKYDNRPASLFDLISDVTQRVRRTFLEEMTPSEEMAALIGQANRYGAMHCVISVNQESPRALSLSNSIAERYAH